MENSSKSVLDKHFRKIRLSVFEKVSVSVSILIFLVILSVFNFIDFLKYPTFWATILFNELALTFPFSPFLLKMSVNFIISRTYSKKGLFFWPWCCFMWPNFGISIKSSAFGHLWSSRCGWMMPPSMKLMVIIRIEKMKNGRNIWEIELGKSGWIL